MTTFSKFQNQVDIILINTLNSISTDTVTGTKNYEYLIGSMYLHSVLTLTGCLYNYRLTNVK